MFFITYKTIKIICLNTIKDRFFIILETDLCFSLIINVKSFKWVVKNIIFLELGPLYVELNVNLLWQITELPVAIGFSLLKIIEFIF